MKFWLRSRHCCVVFAVCLAFLCAGAQVQGKPIRLRNEIIPTDHPRPSAAHPVEPTIGSGLFLIQFTGPLTSSNRNQLSAMGIDLLRPVPEDAFVARFQAVRLDQARAVPFVQWIGQYRPDHKVHREVADHQKQRPTELMGVAILLAARAKPAEISEAKASLSSVQQESTLHAGTVLRGKMNPARLEALARSHAVLWIEPARDMKLFDEVSSKLVAGDGGSQSLLTQSLGYDGEGVTVAVADSGLHNGETLSMHPDLLGRTPAFFHYGTLTDGADEHSHGTHVAGIVAGNGATGETDENGALYGLGVAPGASIIGQRIFDGIGNYESPPSFERLTRDATRAGAVIGSNSWGDDTHGRYDISAMEFDELVRDADALAIGDQPYILEFSAGNAGPAQQSIGSPAVAKNVIATGATENDRADFVVYADGPDTMADFSSRGPCEDGRIKPDVVAPGTWIASLQSESATDLFAWLPISANYHYQGGTSQAGPHVSGAAAVLVQLYRETHTNALPSPALLKAALINSAYDLDVSFGTEAVPNGDEGWGSVDLTAFFDPSLGFRFIEQGSVLGNGDLFDEQVVVGGGEPLKITLTYTDPPGFPGAIPALVNDLDLEVIAPDGQIYRGNQFDDGLSIPDPPGRDGINNVEGVLIAQPLPGAYVVRVRGWSVVADVHGETDEPGQDFALVISGVLSPPGVGNVALDRAAYTVPAQIRIAMVDTDLAGQSSATVLVHSTVEPAGETIVLNAAGSSGSFTGTIATATGPAALDGNLQVAHNSNIEVSYFDASANASRIATARADLVPPVLSNPSVINAFGESEFFWSTDEPATSIVRLGTNASVADMTLAVTNKTFSTVHAIAYGGLIPERTYYYYVVSADEAGNVATNSNSGSMFSFVAPLTASLLLVDEYHDDLFNHPPLSGYTAALDQLGVSYDTWDTSVRGEPSLNNLNAYRAVIWRVEELLGVWSAAEQTAISDYLAGGGALFVASMELLSRLQDAGSTNFIRQVLHVQSFVADPDSSGAFEIVGSPVEQVGNGINTVLDYDVYDAIWQGTIGPDISDTLIPDPSATTVLHNDVGDIVGLRWPRPGQAGPGRLVLLTFPLDAVPLDNGVNDRAHLLRNAISFLAPGVLATASVSFDSFAYSLPSLVTVQVGDSDLRGAGTLNVTVSSTTQSNGMAVTLVETPDAGVFLGSFPLLSATNPPSPGKLLAKNGDDLLVKYFDAGSGAFLNATSSVDTIAPSIMNIEHEEDYQQAIVYWDTSEFTDALVQFGESPLLERTAYNPDPSTAHAVTMFGLVPDRTYYYKVVSRDIAGNVVTDDNNGDLYTVRTLRPLFAPWSDDLNSGATNWAVFSADDSRSQWTLGVPDNGLESSANSPPSAWGSNLKGERSDYTETFLISPAVYLTNGNVAKLTFWHSYDFLVGDFSIEAGQLQIVYNGGSSLAPLADFSEFSDSWEKVEIDLTPYAGQVVYLVWYYLLLSFDESVHFGWLVDDVSITVSNVQPGTIQISNNIWQASYILSGPAYRRAKGISTVVSNAPPGKYILEFADVPYYITPLPQTNTLVSSGTLVFQGNYTFLDANSNSIPDPWEIEKFGTVDPQRTQLTDSDNDGLTDWGEFVAGTNPNGSGAGFRLTTRQLTTDLIELSWPSATNVSYRVHSSSNLLSWSPFTMWLTATGSQIAIRVSTVTNGVKTFFQVEAATATQAGSAAGQFRASVRKLINGQVRIEWPSAAGHAYRILGSSNFQNWSPYSSWIRTSGTKGALTLPPATNGAPFLFRIEAKP